MQLLKANTQVIVTVGPFVDITDGLTPETGVTLGSADEAELLKHGSTTVVDISGATWAAVTTADGYYSLTLTTSHTDTEGMLVVIVQDDSLCLPVKAEFMVMAQAAYDSMFAAKDTGYMDVNVKAVSEDTTAADNLESACDNYSATRGLSGTALPNAAADAAGGLAISDAGGLDMDSIKTDTAAILVDTAVIGATGGGLTSLATQASVDVIDGIVDSILVDTAEIGAAGAGLTVLATAAALATVDTVVDGIQTDLSNGTDGLGAIKGDTAAILTDTADMQPKLGSPAADVSADIAAVKADTAATLTDTAVIGAAGAGLTAVPWNAAWDAEVQSEVNDGLVALKLDHLVAVADADDAVDDSIVAKLASTTGDWSTFVPGDDSLQAISESGGGGPTAADIADAVWDEAKGDHTGSTTFGDLATDVDTANTNISALNNLSAAQVNAECDTAITDAALATAAALATVDSNVDANKVILDALTAAAAAKLATSAGTIVSATVDTVTNTHTPTTTEFQADDVTEATADHYNGRIVIFTSGVLANQATDITDYAAVGGIGQFTVTAMTEAPSNNDTFIIV